VRGTRRRTVGGRALAAVGLLGAVLAGSCTDLDPRVLYLCESDGGCVQRNRECRRDGYCHPLEASDGGIACRPTGGCPPSAECGFFDAGCGVELTCGQCEAPYECGVSRPLACARPRLCTREGWCYENPLPQGNTIRAGWAADPRHVWWAGDDATVLFWNGEHHDLVPMPGGVGEGVDFLAVHGTSAKDVYAVGTGGTIAHFDGVGWTLELIEGDAKPTLRGVWARGEKDVVAVGDGAAIVRRTLTGRLWNVNSVGGVSGDLIAVTTRADGLFSAVTGDGVLLREEAPGSVSWVAEGSCGLDATSLWTSSDGSRFVLGTGMVILPDGASAMRGLVARQEADGGWRSVVQMSFTPRVLRGTSSQSFYVGGAEGYLFHVVDGGIARWPDGGVAYIPRAPAGIHALVAFESEALVQGNDGMFARYVSGPFPNLEARSEGSTRDLRAVCAETPLAAVAVGLVEPGCLRACAAPVIEREVDPELGIRWAYEDRRVSNQAGFSGCLVRGEVRLAVGDGPFVHRRALGTGWSAAEVVAPAPAGPQDHTSAWWFPATASVYFTSASTGPAVVTAASLDLSQVASHDVPSQGRRLNAFAGTATSGWAVGEGGLVVELRGSGTFTAPVQLGSATLNAVSAATLTDGGTLVVAVGGGGAIFRREGVADGSGGGFLPDPSVGHRLQGVWASPSGESWAVGSEQTPLRGGLRRARVYRRLPGSPWTAVPLLRQGSLSAVWGWQEGARTSVWVVGDRGAILRLDAVAPGP
jgi:hypothetical protein